MSARKQAVIELLGLPCIPLAALAAADSIRSQDPEAVSPFAMDVIAINAHSEPIAEAVAELANAYPVLGTLLDRIGATTPFMALTVAFIGLAAQLAENHGSLPAGMQGISPTLIRREDFAQQIRDEARARANA